jgi:hypothetical protein
MVAIASIASLSSFGQVKQVVNKTTVSKTTPEKKEVKVLKSNIEFKLQDGMDQWLSVPFKVLSVTELDSIAGSKSYDLTEWAAMTANLELKYSMKDKYSYKPLKVESNNIMYFFYKNTPYIVVQIACEAKNGYGNPISKLYSVWLKYDNTQTDISKSLTFDHIM